MDLFEDINKHIVDDNHKVDFFNLYSFTTENISGYIPYFDLKGKNLLTVGSSSDQVINACISGCEDITIYDICPLTKYFYYLKLASLLRLSRDEFLNFLCKTNYKNNRKYNPHLLTKGTFNKIKNILKTIDYESYYLWDYIFKKYNRSQIERLFREDINDLESIIYCNTYLKNDYNYDQARKRLANVSFDFLVGDISSIEMDRKFYNIWLSNVAQYLYRDRLIQMVSNNTKILDDNGKMLICYFWNTSMTVRGFPIEELINIKADKIIIPGIFNYDKNSVLVYKKNK